MACFIAPAAEAVVVTAVYCAAKRKEKKVELEKYKSGVSVEELNSQISFSRKLSWLMIMLWGGVLLLAFEHFWHGEIQPFAPFITAMSNPEDTAQMLREVFTVGIAMAASVTLIWGGLCAFVSAKTSKKSVATKTAR